MLGGETNMWELSVERADLRLSLRACHAQVLQYPVDQAESQQFAVLPGHDLLNPRHAILPPLPHHRISPSARRQ